ncbi:MAG: S8 family serine peptidase [Erysipelotrichaceae bacterium]
MKKMLFVALTVCAMLFSGITVSAATTTGTTGINVLLNRNADAVVLKDLGKYGTVLDVVAEIHALTMRIKTDKIAAVKALPYVTAVSVDAVRNGAPIDTVAAENFSGGMNTWNLDAINVTNFGTNVRSVEQDGTGVYVAVLDTGLVDAWRQYFPQERIATEYAIAFGGGGGETGNVSTPTNKWEHDQNSHGTHVTSTILGYSMSGTKINGVAPMATIIPVKVLNQNGSGWSSVIAQGIIYVADLKKGPLSDHPVVINMSLGGSALEPMEQAAIDYAIKAGVIIVASAGNEGEAGMGYPGAYAPVISVAASGWTGEWTAANFWRTLDVADPNNINDFYITDFSSRAKTGQDLDIAAPGSWIVGPYQKNSGQISYFFLGGTSMASPHIAGIVALMAQKDKTLTAAEAETILESSALPLPAGSRTITNSDKTTSLMSWGSDATGAGLVDAIAALAATN